MKRTNLPVYTSEKYGLPIFQHYIYSNYTDQALQYAEHLVESKYYEAYQYPCNTAKCDLKVPHAIFYAIRKHYFSADVDPTDLEKCKKNSIFTYLVKYSNLFSKSADMKFTPLAEAIWLGQPHCANYILSMMKCKDPVQTIINTFYEHPMEMCSHSDYTWEIFFQIPHFNQAINSMITRILANYGNNTQLSTDEYSIIRSLPTTKVKAVQRYNLTKTQRCNAGDKRPSPLNESPNGSSPKRRRPLLSKQS